MLYLLSAGLTFQKEAARATSKKFISLQIWLEQNVLLKSKVIHGCSQLLGSAQLVILLYIILNIRVVARCVTVSRRATNNASVRHAFNG